MNRGGGLIHPSSLKIFYFQPPNHEGKLDKKRVGLKSAVVCSRFTLISAFTAFGLAHGSSYTFIPFIMLTYKVLDSVP